jgi:hypothetical protein
VIFFNSILSVFIGSIAGYIYGLLFVASKQKAFSLSASSRTKNLSITVGLSLLRFAFFGAFLIYLLRWGFLGSILTLASFLAAFWLSIIRKGLTHHDGRNPN